MRPDLRHQQELIHDETVRLRQEGRSVPDLASLSPEECWLALAQIPPAPELDRKEPQVWEIPHFDAGSWSPDESEIQDRMLGAWQGRIAGCILGKPFEFQEVFFDWTKLRSYLQETNQWPLTDFAVNHPNAARRHFGHDLTCSASWRENIAFAESDDDLRYSYAGVDILDRCGSGFRTQDVAAWWLNHLTPSQLFTAEQAVFRSLYLSGRPHPWEVEAFSDEDMMWVRQHQNPYVEWIGAAIRADGWAWGFAGNPESAAIAAQKDARLSHERNGEYSEVFFAAWISAAFRFELEEAMEVALGFIPPESRLAEAISRTRLAAGSLEDDDVLAWLHEEFDHYHPVHAINNAAACVAAVVRGGGDFGRSIGLAVMAGWDTDCNGATVGSLLGARLGANAIPNQWTSPFCDRIELDLREQKSKSIRELAAWTVDVWRKNRG